MQTQTTPRVFTETDDAAERGQVQDATLAAPKLPTLRLYIDDAADRIMPFAHIAQRDRLTPAEYAERLAYDAERLRTRDQRWNAISEMIAVARLPIEPGQE